MIRRFVREYLRPQGRLLVPAMLLLVPVAALELLSPYFNRLLVDRYFLAHADPTGAAFLTGLQLLLASSAFALTVRLASRWLQSRLIEESGQRATVAMRQQVFDSLAELPLTRYDQDGGGEFLHLLGADLEALAELQADLFVSLAWDCLMLILVTLVLLTLNPTLWLVAALPLPIPLLLSWSLRGSLGEAARRERSVGAELQSFLQEQIEGYAEIRLFQRQQRQAELHRQLSGQLREVAGSTLVARSGLAAASDLAATLSLAGVLGYGAWLVMEGQTSLGTLAAFLLYLQILVAPVRDLTRKAVWLPNMLAAFGRITRHLDSLPPPAAAPLVPLPGKLGDIQIENLWFGYSSDQDWVLQDISLQLKAGSSMAIVGPSGAGKSTIVSLLLGFYEFKRGRVLINGLDFTTIDPKDLRRRAGVVFQDSYLYEEAEGSRGEMQVRAIRRALSQGPEWLLLDEATSCLDIPAERALMAEIREQLQARTCLLVAHRLETIEWVDQILVLQGGRIAERGTHQELVERNGLYAEMQRAQQQSSA